MVSSLENRLHRFSRSTSFCPAGSRLSGKKQITQITAIALAVLCLLLNINSCFAAGPRQVRILILRDASSLSLRIDGFCEIQDSTHKILYRGRNLRTTAIVSEEAVSLGKNKLKSEKLFIIADNPLAVVINGRKFRGNVCLVRSQGRINVVNYIELDDYIKGVLIYEASHYWPQEALKALVVVCRSFALYQMQENSGRDYDLTSDIYSQVYGGKGAERYRLNESIEEAKDLALTYQGKILPAFHHATCAGHTEDASLLWNINLAPLKGVVCNFCKDSPHYNWHLVLSITDAKKKLAASGYKLEDINDITILGRDPSGRITDLKISGNKDIVISAKDLRNCLGPNEIRSANFKVRLENHDIVFEGLGWGHGVGLCQWGAYFMAKEGYNFKQILDFYYPGSTLSSYETVRF